MICPPIQSHKFNFIVKFALFTFLLLNSIQLFAQLNQFPCDSIKLKNGKILKATIIEKKKRKIRYFNNQKVGWKIKKIRCRRIDSIYYVNQENAYNQRDSFPILKLSKIDSQTGKVKEISEGQLLLLKTKDSINYRGKLLILNRDTIIVRTKRSHNESNEKFTKYEHFVALKDVTIIKKPSKASKIIGNTIGGLFVYIGAALLIDFGGEDGAAFMLISDAFSTPFFAMNYIRKRYNLQTKWKAEIKFHKTN